MEPSESKPNTKEVVEAKPVKEIAERAVSLETKASAKSAVDHLDTHGLEAAPVTGPEGTLVGKISKDRMIRGVSGRGHDPETTPVEPEVEKEGEPYCYEHEPIAKAEEVMREMKVDAISVVSEEKKLVGKATQDAIEEERLKAESGKPRTDLKDAKMKPNKTAANDRRVLVLGPKHALDAFEKTAHDAGLDAKRRPIHEFSAEPKNIAECLQLIFSKEGAAIFIALASVIKSFLAAKSSRRMTITKLEHDKIEALDARGYSEKELAELLPKCRELIVYDEKAEKPPKV